MDELPNFELVMAHIREQLEAYREDATDRLQQVSKRLEEYAKEEDKLETRLNAIVDIMESTVDVFLRQQSAIEMQLRVTRLWAFLALMKVSESLDDPQMLAFVNDSKESLSRRLAELWKAPLESVVPIRNTFVEDLKQQVKASGFFD